MVQNVPLTIKKILVGRRKSLRRFFSKKVLFLIKESVTKIFFFKVCGERESNPRTPTRTDLESVTVDHLVISAV